MPPYAKRYVVAAPRRRRTVQRRRVAAAAQMAAGYVRTSGYYGRYAGSGTRTPEHKFFDTTATFGTVDTAGEINASLNLIPQGVTESTRIGRECILKSLEIKGDWSIAAAAGAQSPLNDRLRIIFYQDKQANGAAAVVLDILETADILSFRNLSNQRRFRILSDVVVNTNVDAAGGNVGGADTNWASKFGTVARKMKLNMPLEFSNTTGAITELRSNNIGILAITEGGFTTFKFNARVRFSET